MARFLDALVVGISAFDLWLNIDSDHPVEVGCGILACAALAVRRRFPRTVFLLGVPATLFFSLMAVPFATLYTLARHARNRLLLAGCTLLSATADSLVWPLSHYAQENLAGSVVDFGYLLAAAVSPVFLGQLVQAHHDLALRLADIEEARDHERQLHAQNMLARERAQLAREMHDVVSHQVSLIAVQAGALQVSAADRATTDAARTIRQLSVTTLDELRHMVTLLRMSGGDTAQLSPQPTLADLRRLVDGSGLDSSLEGELPADVAATAQRTLYRTVQEALTNVRKHAPGATATVRLWHDEHHLGVTVTNSPPTRATLPLPGAHHGLVGLRERADILRGRFESGPTPEGGFEVRLTIPYEAEPTARPTAEA
ncbi:histidine kinase [Streptomyces sp. NPDC003077]|uniref:sensor histidine kinase n=1 Tax=Streptomyces sp. NPDC003077 TaxID=3154443 RepID=UPI0033A3F67C